MKFTGAVLALAAVAIAAPTELEARTGGEGGGSVKQCNASQTAACCNNSQGLLGVITLSCTLNSVLGKTCSNEAYCCDSNAVQGIGASLINVNATNCVKIL